MKKFILPILTALLCLVSCEFDDSAIWDAIKSNQQSIKDHENRIVHLEQLCTQMNTSISSMQVIIKALQNNDFITSIAPIKAEDKEIGYVISFSKHEAISIYHGKNGADGAPGQDGQAGASGQDGHTPSIGVKKDTDGCYYWTLDGAWLLNENGEKVNADGVNGTPGENGLTPELKIMDDYWYVRYGEGEWKKLGKATGSDGKDGQNGDTIFKDIIISDTDITFILANGERIAVPRKGNIPSEGSEKTKIYYTSTDGKPIKISYLSGFAGFNLLSNDYVNGQGVLTFEGELTGIGSKAFYSCVNLKTMTLPTDIQYIGEDAFENCRSLIEINLSQNLYSIGEGAFSGCSNLTSICIPENVMTIGGYTFEECDKLLTIYCKPKNVPSVYNALFYVIPSDCKIYVPKESLEAYKSDEGWSRYAAHMAGYDFTKKP